MAVHRMGDRLMTPYCRNAEDAISVQKTRREKVLEERATKS